MHTLQLTYSYHTAKPDGFVFVYKILPSFPLSFTNNLSFVLFFACAKKIQQHAIFACSTLDNCLQTSLKPYRALYGYIKYIWLQYKALHCYSRVFLHPKASTKSYSQHFEKPHRATKTYSQVLEIPYRGTKASSKSSEHTYGHQYIYSKTILHPHGALYGGSKFIGQETIINDKR